VEVGPGKSPCCSRRNALYIDKFTDNKDGTPEADIVADAWSIPLGDESADFVFSSHCLEHCLNTLKTLYEWKRLLKKGGVLFLVLPHGDRTFDRYRAKTHLAHHIDDFNGLGDEPDPTHIEEIRAGWAKYELSREEVEQYTREWGAAPDDFEFRVKNGVIHYHVWTQSEMVDVLRYAGFQILHVAEEVLDKSNSFMIVSRKTL